MSSTFVIKAVAEALRRLINDPSQRTIMGEQAQAWVRDAFTWPRIVQQLEAVYRQHIHIARSSR